MPKDRSHSYPSSARSRPYSSSSKHAQQCGSKSTLPSIGDEREWEEAKCAICMEHPHNAVLLLCSSHEKGCRPYMCDTSYRHSNCLDQFRKSSPSIQTTDLAEDFSHLNGIKKLKHKLPCPLCRGEISGWMVLEPARSFMNAKPRSCSLESCEFIGTYPGLRTHARSEHPYVCPTKADPTRQQEWTRLENEMTYQDLLGVSRVGNLDLLSVDDDYSSFLQNLETDSDWEEMTEDNYSSVLQNLETVSEWDDMMDMNLEVELPFTFIEMPFVHSDPYCPYHTSADHIHEWSYPIARSLNRSTSQPDNMARDYSLRRSNSARGQRQQNRQL